MCGISGIVGLTDKHIKHIQKMNRQISHRGPDDEGYFLADEESIRCLSGEDTSKGLCDSLDGNIKDYNPKAYLLSFGHRRLSILDISNDGFQPMPYSSRRFWIIFNGEIYNYIELKDELKSKGYHFSSATDTEVILAAYEEWGIECQNKFIGMWSFAIYDSASKEVFISRDRFGIKPLYYWFSPEDVFHFGSEIKQFTNCNGWEAKLNSQRAYDYLFYSLTDHTDETMFSDVNHIPAGHYVKERVDNFRPGIDRKIKTKRWYTYNPGKSNISFREASSQFEHLFKNAINLHLRSDVPVGSALSGGLDSSAIVCEINNLLREKGKNELQKTFSSVAKDPVYSEKVWMDEVIKATNVEAHFVYPSADNLFQLTPKILWHQDEPYQSQSAFLGYHVFELAHQKGVKVLLNGQGADEYLSGYGEFRNLRLRQNFFNGKFTSVERELSDINMGFKDRLTLYLKFINSKLPAKLSRITSRQSYEFQKIKAILNINAMGADHNHPFNEIKLTNKGFQAIAENQLFHNPLPRYLRWEDRNSMAHSIEARVPFLDHRLVEFTTSLPVEYLDGPGKSKRLMVEGLDKILPEKILNRKDKKGFMTPEEKWVKVEYTSEIRSKINEAIGVSNGIITSNSLKYYDQVSAGKIPFDYTYWRLIMFSEWIKLFNVKI